jgi:hypothetical protein
MAQPEPTELRSEEQRHVAVVHQLPSLLPKSQSIVQFLESEEQ